MKKGLTDIPMHGALMSTQEKQILTRNQKQCTKKKKNVGYTNAPVQNYEINAQREQNQKCCFEANMQQHATGKLCI